MAKEIDTIELAQRAEDDLKYNGVMSRSVYWGVLEAVRAGFPISFLASMHDTIKIRRVLAYHKQSNIMHQHVLEDGRVRLFFNIDD